MQIKPLRAAVFLALPLIAYAQNLKEFERRVTEFTLTNGMHFIVLERHERGSCHTTRSTEEPSDVDGGGSRPEGGHAGREHTGLVAIRACQLRLQSGSPR